MNKATVKLADYVCDNLGQVEIKLLAQKLLLVLKKQKKIRALPSLLEYIEDKLASAQGKKMVKISTYNELTSEEKERVIRAIEHKLHKKIVAKFKTDESIIGGIKIEYDEETIDLTVKNRLKRLKNKLAGEI